MYATNSGRDRATLYQLRNLINRRNVISHPKHEVTACEDFFVLIVKAHIISACMEVFEMCTLEDRPSEYFFPNNVEKADHTQRESCLMNAMSKVLSQYVDLQIFKEPSELSSSKDYIHNYAKEVLSLGLLYMEFLYAVKEGDGNRIL